MDTEKMRAEFEAWACTQFDAPPEALRAWRTDEAPEDGYPYRSGNDEVDLAIGSAWLGWQASRAAIEIDLPEPREGRRTYLDDDARDEGWNDCLAVCKDAIEAAGLTVKE